MPIYVPIHLSTTTLRGLPVSRVSVRAKAEGAVLIGSLSRIFMPLIGPDFRDEGHSLPANRGSIRACTRSLSIPDDRPHAAHGVVNPMPGVASEAGPRRRFATIWNKVLNLSLRLSFAFLEGGRRGYGIGFADGTLSSLLPRMFPMKLPVPTPLLLFLPSVRGGGGEFLSASLSNNGSDCS